MCVVFMSVIVNCNCHDEYDKDDNDYDDYNADNADNRDMITITITIISNPLIYPFADFSYT
jgi:hypothetical protein